jgi:hypothetical protein
VRFVLLPVENREWQQKKEAQEIGDRYSMFANWEAGLGLKTRLGDIDNSAGVKNPCSVHGSPAG